jgi:hypothetical protein
MICVLAAAVLSTGVSCGTVVESELHRAELIGGQAVQELAGDSGMVAVLLFDPRLCLTCAQTLGDWVSARRSTPERVRIVLSRSPTVEEERILVRLRRAPDGVLANDAYGVSREFLFRDGRLEAQRASDFTAGARLSPMVRTFIDSVRIR